MLARFYALDDNGQLDSSTANSIVANTVAYGYVIANVQCQQSFVDEQVQDFECTNAVIGNLVQNSKNCKECKALAAQVAQSRAALEEDAHKLNPDYVIQKVDPALETAYTGPGGDANAGVCKYICEQCVVENVSQNIQMRIVEECSSRVTQDEFINAFTSGMSIQAENEINRHLNQLKSTGLDIKSQDDVKRLALEMATTIRDMTTITQLSSLNQDALNIQETKITPGSTSVAIQNSTQAISMSMFASLVSRRYTDLNVQTSIGYDIQQKTIQIETSFSDLVKELETTVKTMNTLLLSTVGKIMITLVALLLVIMIIFASFFFFRPSFLFGDVFEEDDSQ